MIPADGSAFVKDPLTAQEQNGLVLKSRMNEAKSARDAALKKFKKSFNDGLEGLGKNMLSPDAWFTGPNQATVVYRFPKTQNYLANQAGVAFGFPGNADALGHFKKSTDSSYAYLTRSNTAGRKTDVQTTPRGSSGGKIRLGTTKSQFYIDYSDYVTKRNTYEARKKAYDAWEKKYGKKTTSPQDDDKKGPGGAPKPKKPSAPTEYTYGEGMKYNLPAVNEMYFSPGAHPGGVKIAGGNQPVKRVSDAQELWTDQHFESVTTGTGKKKKTVEKLVDNGGGKSAYKGMIQSLTRSAAQTATGGGQETAPSKGLNAYKMGFQFQYNPSRIGTTWQGTVNVDVGFVASGKDKFGPVGSSLSTGSGVTVTIPINRLSDMKYVNTKESEWSDMPWRELYGISLKEGTSGKESKTPTFEDLRRIRDLGTMYDVEFLLQTILGYRMKSAIRLNRHSMTADLGYLGGQPVELHLGKNIRYYVSVNSISINHSIFTKDMIPTLSELTITCSRIPDYISKN